MYPNKLIYRICFLSMAVGSFSFSGMSLEAKNEILSYGIEDKEEAFLVRRIAEFWKDQDYPYVKSQIIAFLAKYPKSTLKSHLLGILGDLYVQENAYQEALKAYDQIQDTKIQEKVLINKLQCYYELSDYKQMIATGSPYLTKNFDGLEHRFDEFNFLMAEAFFRAALDNPQEKEQLQHLTKAEPLYEKVLSTSFADPTMFALAEIYRLKKDHEKAAHFFTELAQKHTDQKQELLFHAALAQAEFNKDLAVQTFGKIVEGGGSKAQDAALNRLILFFQENRYADVIAEYKKVSENVDAGKASLLNFMIGRSYFGLEDYDNAHNWLEKCIHVNAENREELRSAILMELNSLQSLKKQKEYKEVLTKFQAEFPQDAEIPKAQFIYAMMQKESGDLTGAEESLFTIMQNNPTFSNLENLYLEYSLVAFNNHHYANSYSTLSFFLKTFPESSHAKVAWKHFLACSIQLLGEAEQNPSIGYTKEVFYRDLTKVLAVEGVLSPSEKEESLFLRGKMAYEIGLPQDTLNYLQEYLSIYPESRSNPEAHLLIALAHHKLGHNPKLFCEHAEIALKENPSLQNRASIHLELFNSYIAMIEELEKKEASSEPKNSPLYELAADHLYRALEAKDLPVQIENKLWLANLYLDKSLKQNELYEIDGQMPASELSTLCQRSQDLLESVLLQSATHRLSLISQDKLFLEWEAMKLANLYGRAGKNENKLALLKDLIEIQNAHAKWDWKLRKEALVELAKTYETMGHQENALDTFAFIAKHFQSEPSFATEYAQLHAARLKFSYATKEKKNTENDTTAILSMLKEMQIRKSAHSEPLHLESALEYAWIRAQLADESEKAMRYLFFLNRIKEDYDNLEDPMVATYHKELSQNRSKEAIYHAYMAFLNAEIKRCEAVIALKENKAKDASLINQEAKNALSQIYETTFSFYLKERAKISLHTLKKGKIV